jgi:hypothetical protein
LPNFNATSEIPWNRYELPSPEFRAPPASTRPCLDNDRQPPGSLFPERSSHGTPRAPPMPHAVARPATSQHSCLLRFHATIVFNCSSLSTAAHRLQYQKNRIIFLELHIIISITIYSTTTIATTNFQVLFVRKSTTSHPIPSNCISSSCITPRLAIHVIHLFLFFLPRVVVYHSPTYRTVHVPLHLHRSSPSVV